ncbi:MAG: hypothetical protein MZU95_09035 [Desulfomicrobium escambiense]|nr:hypothetical protein [Desulfomicrobium escambiense]
MPISPPGCGSGRHRGRCGQSQVRRQESPGKGGGQKPASAKPADKKAPVTVQAASKKTAAGKPSVPKGPAPKSKAKKPAVPAKKK